jgi:uncharacterized protein YggE
VQQEVVMSAKFLILAWVSGCSAIPFVGEEPREVTSRYTVSGTATVNAKQDEAALTVTLTADARTPKLAAAEVRDLQSSLDAAVDASGVDLDDRAWSGLRLSPVYEPIDSRGIRKRLAGYQATHSVTLTVSDFDTLPELMELAASSGATRIDSAFRVADRPALKKQARELAAKAARSKAVSMTELLGVELGPILGIVEGNGVGGFDNNEANFMHNRVVSQPGTGTHGQEEGVTVTVTLTYELG